MPRTSGLSQLEIIGLRTKGFSQPSTLGRIFKDAQKFKPAFFLWCGDTIYGHTSDEQTLDAQYQDFFSSYRGRRFRSSTPGEP